MKFLRIALLRNLVHQLIFLKVKNPHNFMKDHKTKGEKGKSKEKNFEIPHRMRAIRWKTKECVQGKKKFRKETLNYMMKFDTD